MKIVPLYVRDPRSGLYKPELRLLPMSGGADWPMGGLTQRETAGPATTGGTSITGGTPAHTKASSWTQVISSTAFAAYGMWVSLGGVSSANISFLADVAFGAAASEYIILPDLGYNSHSGLDFWATYFFPIDVPSGTRISARCQSSTASTAMGIRIVLAAASLLEGSPYQLVTAYGENTAASNGTSIDPGGTADTEGAWTQLDSSTANPIEAFCVFIGNQLNSVRSDARYLVDIGYGASTAEFSVVGDIAFQADTGTDVCQPMAHGAFSAGIPVSSRLVARGMSSITDATDRLFDCIVYGIC